MHPRSTFVNADALALPFGDGVFDAVTISFGLRNVEDTGGRAGGAAPGDPARRTIVICEFSTPTWAPVRWAYHDVALRALPLIARLSASNPVAYEYLAESIRDWPVAAPAGRSDGAGRLAPTSQWKNLTGGIVALHRGRA